MNGGEDPTQTSAGPPSPHPQPRTPRAATATSAASHPSHLSSIPADREYLPAGLLLAGRYRIVSRLGGGGMGEVYRADDLTLAQSVALKFLPPGALDRPGWLDRFRAEVRLTRQISHPGVCRVYDIAEVDGRVFLSMEFVDGEDLSSLIRRIGRLPQDKAVQLARQICFAVAAAHDLGVVHRDLKPANIMLDGRGNARVMDFGVAGVAAELNSSGAVAAGTPAYMAPEQLEGREVSRRSDIYSLGLVLYEVFTGKPAFSANSLAELRHAHASGTRPASLTQLVGDLDPAVETVILRCLEADPARRPASAVAVAAALPGGDPLAAALAAGETPSPELVAASGEAGTLKPALAIALAAAAIILMVAVTVIRDRLSILRYAALDHSPEVLASKARESLQALGYTDRPHAETYGLLIRTAMLSAIEREDDSLQRWNKLSDPALSPLTFWFRASPYSLQPSTWWQMSPAYDDPPVYRPGEMFLTLDTRGQLRSLNAVAASRELRPAPAAPASSQATTSTENPAPTDTTASPTPPSTQLPETPAAPASRDAVAQALTRAIGLPAAPVTPLPPSVLHAVPTDDRWSFSASLPGKDPLPVTIEVGQARGKVVSVETIFPWSYIQPVAGEDSLFNQVVSVAASTVQLTLLISAGFMARKNLKTNRADRRGGARVAAVAFSLSYIASLLLASWDNPGAALFGVTLVRCFFLTIIWWVSYCAMEPVVRKIWPHAIISWSRLLEGRWRDPLVGRDILLGCLAGLAIILLQEPAIGLAHKLLALAPPRPINPNVISLISARYALGQCVDAISDATVITLLVALGLVLLRAILRIPQLVKAALFLVLYVTAMSGPFEGAPYPWLLGLPWAALMTFVFIRLGVLGGSAMIAVAFIIMRTPITFDTSRWYAAPGLVIAAALAGTIILAARTTIGRQPVFKPTPLEH